MFRRYHQFYSDNNIVEITRNSTKKIESLYHTGSNQTLSNLNFDEVDSKSVQRMVLKQNWSKCLFVQDNNVMVRKIVNNVSYIYQICPIEKTNTCKNIIPRDKKVLMRQNINISNRLNKQLNGNQESPFIKIIPFFNISSLMKRRGEKEKLRQLII